MSMSRIGTNQVQPTTTTYSSQAVSNKVGGGGRDADGQWHSAVSTQLQPVPSCARHVPRSSRAIMITLAGKWLALATVSR